MAESFSSWETQNAVCPFVLLRLGKAFATRIVSGYRLRAIFQVKGNEGVLHCGAHSQHGKGKQAMRRKRARNKGNRRRGLTSPQATPKREQAVLLLKMAEHFLDAQG